MFSGRVNSFVMICILFTFFSIFTWGKSRSDGLESELSSNQVRAILQGEETLQEQLTTLLSELDDLSLESKLDRIDDFVVDHPKLFLGTPPLRERYSVYLLRRAVRLDAELQKISADLTRLRARVWRVSILKSLEFSSRTVRFIEKDTRLNPRNFDDFIFEYAQMLERLSDSAVHVQAQSVLLRASLEYLRVDLSRQPDLAKNRMAIRRITDALQRVETSTPDSDVHLANRGMKKALIRYRQEYESRTESKDGKVIALEVDGDTSCVLLESGRVKCWGRTSHLFGSVGLPASPILEALPLRGAKEISLAGDTLCSLQKTQNRGLCIGYDKGPTLPIHYGSLHRNIQVAQMMYDDKDSLPWSPKTREWGQVVPFRASARANGLEIGRGQACFFDEGALFCLGRNYSRGLFHIVDPVFKRARSFWGQPLRVRRSRGARDFSVYDASGCLISAKRKLFCWGAIHDTVDLFEPGASKETSVPRRVRYSGWEEKIEDENFAFVSVGTDEICAVSGQRRNRLWCYGNGLSKRVLWQLESIRSSFSFSLVKVFDQPIRSIDVTARNTICLLFENGSVRCLGGRGLPGQDISDLFDVTVRPEDGDGSPFIRIEAGWSHFCALTQKGRVFCWGNNEAFQVNTMPLEDFGANQLQEVQL